MRRRSLIIVAAVAVWAVTAVGCAAVPVTGAWAAVSSGPSSAVSLPITGYQMAVDSVDDQVVETSNGTDYSPNLYRDSGITPTSVTLTAKPANLTVGNQVTVTGTLTIGGAIPTNTLSINITRTGAGKPSSSFTPDVRFGEFTWIDLAPPPGTWTYTATYPATATSAASSASVKVTVVKAAPSFSLTAPATASYGQAVKFSAHLGTTLIGTPEVSTVSVYAQTAGSTARTRIASGLAGGSSTITGTAHFDKSTTLYAVYPGNSVYTAVTVTKTVNVHAKVTASIGGYYGTKSGYRLFHHTARVHLSAAVSPVKKGECVQFQVQEYVKKTWRTVVTTGCAALNSKSQATGSLTVSKYAKGVPYRVRADYMRGKDTANLDADSDFLDFIVRP